MCGECIEVNHGAIVAGRERRLSDSLDHSPTQYARYRCRGGKDEDTETSHGELVQRFGSKVADIVAEVTDDKSLLKFDRKRKQIEHAPHTSKEAALVKLADKTCNLRDVANRTPKGWSFERKQEYFDWGRAVVSGLPQLNARMLAAFEAAYALRSTE